LFAGSFRIGGSERQAVALTRQLAHAAVDVHVACFHTDGPLGRELPASVQPIHFFPLRSFGHPTTLLRAASFVNLVRQKKIQIVQCFDFYANLFAIPLARLAGVPIVLGSRRDAAAVRTPNQQRVERWCFRMATGVVANSPLLEQQLIREDRLSPEKVWTIQNGLDIDRFSSNGTPGIRQIDSERRGLTVAVVANLRPEKGHFVFLDAVKRLMGRHPDHRYVIAGDGPLRGDLESAITRLELSERVRLVGEVHDVPALLRDIDLVVLPSTTNEGAPNALMEAMAAGKPVVATAVGGTPDVVDDGTTGILVEPGNPSALAEGIERLTENHELRHRMGRAGRAKVEKFFGVDRMGREYRELYRRLLDAEHHR
jgi:glycosyltransferase involved in cell wall biosynthesis